MATGFSALPLERSTCLARPLNQIVAGQTSFLKPGARAAARRCGPAEGAAIHCPHCSVGQGPAADQSWRCSLSTPSPSRPAQAASGRGAQANPPAAAAGHGAFCRTADHWLPRAAPAPQPPRGRNGGGAGRAGCSAADRVTGSTGAGAICGDSR
jgi:hypothetical protein